MHKKILRLLLTLTIVSISESSPVNFGMSQLNNLDEYAADFDDDMESFSTFLDVDHEAPSKKGANEESTEKAKTKVNTSGKKTSVKESKDVHSKYNNGDVKKLFKTGGLQDYSTYVDTDAYTMADAIDSTAAVTKGTETRTYKKGKTTKGFHRVHHKDEYKKDQDFYEDDETTGIITTKDVKGLAATVSAGAAMRRSTFGRDRFKSIYGKQGKVNNGFVDKKNTDFHEVEELYSGEAE